MRRIVDLTVPVCAAIAVLPLVPQVTKLPNSLELTLGQKIGILWAVSVAALSVVLIVGVLLRVKRPGIAFTLEYISLISVGLVSSIFASAIVYITGWGRGWTSFWYINVIGFHCLARWAELARARHLAKRRPLADTS